MIVSFGTKGRNALPKAIMSKIFQVLHGRRKPGLIAWRLHAI